MFGCIGYAKVEKPYLKKLDDRSRILVHLGTEPGSKAYRMLDPKTRKIIVSRDVVFEETKGWNWSHNNSEENKVGDFKITLGEFGNYGIQENNLDGDKSPKGEEDIKTEDEDLSRELITQGEIHENNEEADEEEPPLRRSQRQVFTPKYLDDYILLIE